MDDITLARHLAHTVGKKLLQIRSVGMTGQTLGATGDAEAQKVIATLLATHRPHDAMLSEEADDNESRLIADRVWIVDPLDGTREFSTLGREDWAVHIALWEKCGFQSGLVKTAAVGLPARDEIFDTATAVSPPDPRGRLRIIVSRTRPPAFIKDLAAALDAEIIMMGSAGAKVCAILRGEADVYIHSGGQHEWDSAAPLGVALAAGMHVSRLKGSPILYNQADPRVPDFVVCNRTVADPVLRFIAQVA